MRNSRKNPYRWPDRVEDREWYEQLPIVTAGFSVSGFTLDPDACTRAFGLAPTEIGIRGKKRTPESISRLKLSYWVIDSEEVEVDDVESVLWKVVERVWPARDRIAAFAASNPSLFVSFYASVYMCRGQEPIYGLSWKIMRKMAKFKVKYGLNVCDYS